MYKIKNNFILISQYFEISSTFTILKIDHKKTKALLPNALVKPNLTSAFGNNTLA